MRRRWGVALVVGVLVLGACGDDSPTRQAGVDACFEEQAQLYREAAEYSQEQIQRFMPEILTAARDLVESTAERNTAAMRNNSDTLTANLDAFEATGDNFSALMEEAEAACS